MTVAVLACAASPSGASSSSSSHTGTNTSNASLPAAHGAQAPCNVSIPDQWDLGDCPPSLASGASCRPGCPAGFRLSGVVKCIGGNLSTVTCLPRSCNLSEAPEPENGRHGPQCASLEVLRSGQTCEPVCNANWSLSTPSTCRLGVLTLGRCVQCGAGHTFNDSLRDCQECPLGTYKADAGNDPCVPCPMGSDTIAIGSALWSDCLCNSSTYRASRAVGGGEPLMCSPCPENAQIKDVLDGTLREGQSVQDCKCVKPFKKPVRNATTNELLRCRAPTPCPLKDWLEKANLTGPQQWRLQLGSCADYVNASGLPSGQACLLECNDRLAPQVKADLLSAPNRQILCEDGEIVQHPPPGTWCSEASWKLPPILFLVAVTLTAGMAMFNMERRQQSFEQSCSRALNNGIPQGQGGIWQSIKSKIA